MSGRSREVVLALHHLRPQQALVAPELQVRVALMIREEQQLNGRIGALESWSRTTDRAGRTANARRRSPATVDYWLDRVDPDGDMSDDDRHKAAKNAQRAHMLRLAKASAAARRKS
jgi:hypothetical protein